MSRANDAPIIGINWGSSNFRAYLVSPDGTALAEMVEPSGVVGMTRDEMASLIATVAGRWPEAARTYASGMIGSNVGWCEVPYAEAPAGAAELIGAAREVRIGDVAVTLVPGIACHRAVDGQPDIMRGEEIELLGLSVIRPGDGPAVMPGTHTKWVRRSGGRVVDFFTSMSGEIFDRLTAQGLLASIVDGEAEDGPAFDDGVATGLAGEMSLGSTLFGARALVIRGKLAKADAASYLRGLLIGAEVADARRIDPTLGDQVLPLVGNAPLCALYQSALAGIGATGEPVGSRDACLNGFVALDQARRG